MRYAKIHPEVSCCAYKHGVLHDKEAIYPETQWGNGEFQERIDRGFLVEVEASAEDKSEPEIKDKIADFVKSETIPDDPKNNTGIVRGKVRHGSDSGQEKSPGNFDQFNKKK